MKQFIHWKKSSLINADSVRLFNNNVSFAMFMEFDLMFIALGSTGSEQRNCLFSGGLGVTSDLRRLHRVS